MHFDASGSSASSGLIEEYRWDLDGDGFTDETTAEPFINHTYPAGYAGLMQVLVVDDLGRSANASATVLVDEAAGSGTRAASCRRPPTWRPTRPATATTSARRVVGPRRGRAGALGHHPRRRPGDDRTATPPRSVFVEEQPDPWTVALVPMDADGNYGATSRRRSTRSRPARRGTGGSRCGAALRGARRAACPLVAAPRWRRRSRARRGRWHDQFCGQCGTPTKPTARFCANAERTVVLAHEQLPGPAGPPPTARKRLGLRRPRRCVAAALVRLGGPPGPDRGRRRTGTAARAAEQLDADEGADAAEGEAAGGAATTPRRRSEPRAASCSTSCRPQRSRWTPPSR